MQGFSIFQSHPNPVECAHQCCSSDKCCSIETIRGHPAPLYNPPWVQTTQKPAASIWVEQYMCMGLKFKVKKKKEIGQFFLLSASQKFIHPFSEPFKSLVGSTDCCGSQSQPVRPRRDTARQVASLLLPQNHTHTHVHPRDNLEPLSVCVQGENLRFTSV